jgi:hypothetical protein
MIFQNFGFNRLKVKTGAAPAGALFPNQATQVWTSTETAQWLSASSTAFTVGNGVTYSGYSSATSALGNSNAGCLARNGKIYIIGDNGNSTLSIWNTNTNTLSTLTMPGTVGGYTIVYNDYTKCVYVPGKSGAIYVVDTLTDTCTATITNPLGTTYCLLYSSGYDARYIYGNGWFFNNTWFKIDCNNNTATSLSPQTTGGDTLAGVMAANAKLYMGGGGGSTSGFHVWDTNTDTNQFVSAMGNISDKYRTAANHYNGYVYTLPAFSATDIWQIEPFSNGGTAILGSVTSNNICGMQMAADGLIYGVGINSNYGTVYNPVANTVSYFSAPYEGLQWMVMDANGHQYFGGTTDLWKLTASNVPAATLSALGEMNGIIARMR